MNRDDRRVRGYLAGEAVLLLAAQQATENLPDRIALAAAATAEDTAQDAAERVVPAATSTGATEDAAAGCCLRLRLATCGCSALLGELLADVCQHDRCQDRQQFLDQITTTGARSRQRRGDRVAVVAAEDARDELVALLCIDLVDADPAVEQAAGALLGDGGLELARVDLVSLDILRKPADQRRHQRADRVVHLAFIRADLARNVLYGDLCEEIVETRHDMSTFVAGMMHNRGDDTSRFDLGAQEFRTGRSIQSGSLQ